MIEFLSQEILKKVKRLQNGDVSKAMKRMGLIYDINYGVSIPQLRQIANQYELNNELAFDLLNRNIREAKILSSMLINPDSLSIGQMLELSDKLYNLELVEQFSKGVFAKNCKLNTVLPELILGNTWQKLLALYSAGWQIKINKTCNHKLIDWSIEQINNFHTDSDLLIQKASGFLLQSIASIDKAFHAKMVKLAEKMMDEEEPSSQVFAQEFLWLNMA